MYQVSTVLWIADQTSSKQIKRTKAEKNLVGSKDRSDPEAQQGMHIHMPMQTMKQTVMQTCKVMLTHRDTDMHGDADTETVIQTCVVMLTLTDNDTDMHGDADTDSDTDMHGDADTDTSDSDTDMHGDADTDTDMHGDADTDRQ